MRLSKNAVWFWYWWLGTLALYPGWACAQTVIIPWAKNNAPPFYIVDGSNANQGFGDQMQTLVEAALPQFQHRTVYMPLKRLNHYWSLGENYCFSTMIHEPHVAHRDYVLSLPNVYYLAHGIITSAHSGTTSASLAQIIQEQQWRAGIASNRTFGPTIDALLAGKPDGFHLYERPGANSLSGLFKMLLAGRIEFVIDYAFVFNYYRRFPEFSGSLHFTPIKEVHSKGILGAIGCTNNDWGRDIIAQIDSVLGPLLNDPAYQDLMVRWHAQPGQEVEYQRAYETQVLTTSIPANVFGNSSE